MKSPAVRVDYRFTGFLHEVYATLVVRLHHTEPFQQDQLWRYAADFKTNTGKQLGVKLTRRRARALANWRHISIRQSRWRKRSCGGSWMAQAFPVLRVIGGPISTLAARERRDRKEAESQGAPLCSLCSFAAVRALAVGIENSEGEVRWIEVRDWLKRASDNGRTPVRQIVLAGERFDVMSVRRWRERVLGAGEP